MLISLAQVYRLLALCCDNKGRFFARRFVYPCSFKTRWAVRLDVLDGSAAIIPDRL